MGEALAGGAGGAAAADWAMRLFEPIDASGEHAAKRFESLDANGDGALTRNEVEGALTQRGG